MAWTGRLPAQSTEIAAPQNVVFAHAKSGVGLPATLAGLARRRVVEYASPQLDIAASYVGSGDELTVFVYHTTAGAPAVWFDRARSVIETRPIYGTLTVVAPPSAVAARPGGVAGGLLMTWNASAVEYKGTGLAIVPVGHWLIKLRYSSATLDGAAIDRKLREALVALALPDAKPNAVPAVPVTACPDGLTFKGEAKSIKPDATSAIMSAILATPLDQDKLKPVTWCRDPAVLPNSALYRPNRARDAYLLAFQDAGRAIMVAPSSAGLLTASKAPRWSISFITPGLTRSYPDQNRLPDPVRANAVTDGPARSSASTLSGDKTLTISDDLLKK